jgi:hypothetical protein
VGAVHWRHHDREIFTPSEKPHVMLEAEASGQRFQFAAKIAVADDPQRGRPGLVNGGATRRNRSCADRGQPADDGDDRRRIPASCVGARGVVDGGEQGEIIRAGCPLIRDRCGSDCESVAIRGRSRSNGPWFCQPIARKGASVPEISRGCARGRCAPFARRSNGCMRRSDRARLRRCMHGCGQRAQAENRADSADRRNGRSNASDGNEVRSVLEQIAHVAFALPSGRE